MEEAEKKSKAAKAKKSEASARQADVREGILKKVLAPVRAL